MKKKVDLPKVEPVKLKPLFGIKPNIWLTALYLLSLALVVFLICFLPGIINGQKRVTFTSNVGNAAVYVDSKYVGGTPFTTFISSGNHTAEFKVSNQVVDTIDFNVGHPVFLTWLFPRKMSVGSSSDINDSIYKDSVKAFLENVVNYSAILSYENNYNYPPLFGNFSDLLLAYPNLANSDYKEVLNTAFSFITTNEMLNDAKNASTKLSLNYDFSAIEKAVADKSFKLETEHLIGLSRVYSSDLNCPYFSRSGISVNGFTFDNYPVSEAMYYRFVQDNPQWAASNKANLIEQGLVDEYYLSGISLSSLSGSRPIRNVSYYAAKAFCEWLSSISEKQVFIPEELQWTTAANFSDSDFQKSIAPIEANYGPSGVLGSVWELTSTPYVPLLSLFDYSIYDVLEKYNIQAEVIIKGGSYISDETKINTYSIGTAPLSLCSDYMGFRIAWR